MDLRAWLCASHTDFMDLGLGSFVNSFLFEFPGWWHIREQNGVQCRKWGNRTFFSESCIQIVTMVRKRKVNVDVLLSKNLRFKVFKPNQKKGKKKPHHWHASVLLRWCDDPHRLHQPPLCPRALAKQQKVQQTLLLCRLQHEVVC